MNEADLLHVVMDLARLHKWRAYHALPALTRSGQWVTASQGDQGFPDVLLAREGRVLAVELKSNRGRLGPGQAEWGMAFGDAWRLWRPPDIPAIREELR